MICYLRSADMGKKRADSSSDQSRKRAANRAVILRTLHFHGPMQRFDLARRLNIRKSSVTSITAELLEHGYIVELEPQSLRTPLALKTTETCAVVAAVRSFEIHAARVHLDGSLAALRTWPFPANAPADRIYKLLVRAIAQTLPKSHKNVIGLGIAEHGIVDPHAGVSLFDAHLHQWKGVPLRQRLEKRFGIGTRVESEMRCQLWATAWFDKHLRDVRNLIYIGIVRGLGAALIMDGRMIVGRTFSAGEFGHVRAGDEGRICSCGKTDCLETYVSLESIERELSRISPSRPIRGAGDIAAAAKEQGVVLNVLDRVAARLAETICPIVATLDPDALVLGTYAPALTAVFAELLHKHLRTSLAGLGTADVRIIHGSADPRDTLRGMGGIVIDSSFRSGQRTLQPTQDEPTKMTAR